MTTAEATPIIFGRALQGLSALSPTQRAQLLTATQVLLEAVASTQSGGEADATGVAATAAGDAATATTTAATETTTLTTAFPTWPA